MFTPALEEFLKLSGKFNVIPLYQEINADLDTPVSAFLKIKKSDYSFLLESVEGQERIARYSFLGSNPYLVFKAKGRNIEIQYGENKKSRKFVTAQSPLDEVRGIMRNFKAASVSGLPRFCGGLVGFMGYDSVRFFENIPDKNPDDLKLADMLLLLADTMLIFDHVNHTIKIVANVMLPQGNKKLSRAKKVKIYLDARNRIQSINEEFQQNIPVMAQKEANRKNNLRSNFKKSSFEAIVKKGKKYIKQGDIIQVVLSQRFTLPLDKEPFEVYRSLRSINPSPYMFYLKLNDLCLIGASPEMLVRCEGGEVVTHPIAGTRPRGKSEAEDKRLEKELLNDKKEKAEHLMLVDLGRNDLGKVCRTGKVEVSEFMKVERYSHVMHLVSEVRGELDEKRFDIYDCLKAAFPAGTVTGSPKIRAMEIIDELENLRRGPYAGCVGYFSFSHNMDTCITIRTVIVKGKQAFIQAGAGIVADSQPEREYFESLNKARALIEAISG